MKHWILVAWCCAQIGFCVAEDQMGCSRAMRIGAARSASEIAYTEEAWLASFLQAHHCPYTWLDGDMSTQRRLQMLAHGDIDIVIGASKTRERESIAYFSLPYRHELFHLLVRKNAARFPALEDYLQNNYFLIMPRYGVYPDNITFWRQRFAQHNLLQEYKDTAQAYALLQRGRGAVLLISDALYRRALLSNSATEALDFQLQGDEIHAMFGRQSTTPRDLELFNQWLQQHPFIER